MRTALDLGRDRADTVLMRNTHSQEGSTMDEGQQGINLAEFDRAYWHGNMDHNPAKAGQTGENLADDWKPIEAPSC